jgi:hypothetical protein
MTTEVRGLIAGWCMVVLIYEVGWLLLLLLRRRRLSCLLRLLRQILLGRQRDYEGRVYIESELGFSMLRLFWRTSQVFA